LKSEILTKVCILGKLIKFENLKINVHLLK